uniref:Uncharacterized protein n=1 Tax=Chromera velia CCMP2878 TaxID=1169474 RepID=A0A0G4GUI8_9ALVE|eukprot:Cvel_23448.t1-p1 / transcript=Cvel_23448.t1 / gene=Cvel_23448 / organism=Chromera_velia_CCMP2878 / gene_product=hypothetical protein / transcript_product=hypothetical protein / location=Cvel_scaffold2417:22662-27581(+) / protein_length=92 / sequence_SO=supercontig / SO=protein_coding / is_pseudo=false
MNNTEVNTKLEVVRQMDKEDRRCELQTLGSGVGVAVDPEAWLEELAVSDLPKAWEKRSLTLEYEVSQLWSSFFVICERVVFLFTSLASHLQP